MNTLPLTIGELKLLRDMERMDSDRQIPRRIVRNTQNTPKLFELAPYSVPRGYELKVPTLAVDMLTLTMDVQAEEERRAICDRIKAYSDDRVIKQYMPNYCQTNYHNTYQFTVQPRKGRAFVFKLSHSPIDGHLETGKRRFLRLEFNPSAVGSKRMCILRKILCRLLGDASVDQLYTVSVVTRVDLAMDFEGLEEPMYLFKTTARQSSIVRGGSGETQYVGGARSRVRLRWYDKLSEAAARGILVQHSSWYRLEAELRDLRCAPVALVDELRNPFEPLRFFSAEFLHDRFSANRKLERKFRRSVRERGLNATFEADRRWREGRERYLTWLEACGYERVLFDPEAVWGQLGAALGVLDGLWDG